MQGENIGALNVLTGPGVLFDLKTKTMIHTATKITYIVVLSMLKRTLYLTVIQYSIH